MAPIGPKLGQNPFQVIPELSLFDVENRKIFGFFGHDHFVLARTHVSRPGQTDRDQKIQKIFRLRCQKMKVRGSPETRFGQVSGQSEPSSGGKRPIENLTIVAKFRLSGRRKMKRRGSSETRFGQVSGQSEPSSGGKRPIKVRENFRDFNFFGVEK